MIEVGSVGFASELRYVTLRIQKPTQEKIIYIINMLVIVYFLCFCLCFFLKFNICLFILKYK